MGRPSLVITPEMIVEAEKQAARGLTQVQIALCLGISETTLHKNKAKNTEFAAAIKSGQAKGVLEITNNLYAQSKAGNVAATIFYLKNRDKGNWKDQQDLKHGGGINYSVSLRPVEDDL